MNNKIKYIAIIGIGIVGLKELFTGSFLGGLFLILASALIYPPVSEKLKSKFEFWNNRKTRIISVVGLFFLGVGISGGFKDLPSNERDREKIIINYIKNNKQDKSIQNIQKLGDIGYYFGNSNSSIKHPHDGYISEKFDSLKNRYVLTFNPKLFTKNEDIKYLKTDVKNGTLKDYLMTFTINNKDSIISKTTTMVFSKSGDKVFFNKDVPSIDNLLNIEIIEKQKLIVQKKEAKRQEKIRFNEVMGNDDFWNEFDPMVKERLYILIKNKNCKELQKEFTITANHAKRFHKIGDTRASKHTSLMSFIDDKIRKLGCYK